MTRKLLAFLTVFCMMALLGAPMAFADVPAFDEQTIGIDCSEADGTYTVELDNSYFANQQMTILAIPSDKDIGVGITEDDITYIDQDGADADGKLTFSFQMRDLANPVSQYKILVGSGAGFTYNTKSYFETVLGEGGGGITIPSANISINADGNNPYGITGGSVVRVNVTGIIDPTTDNKVVMVKGIQAKYTYYNGVYKYVAILNEAVTTDDISVVDGTPAKLMYGDINFDQEITGTDAALSVAIALGNRIPTDLFEFLAADVNADLEITGTDAATIVGLALGNLSTAPAFSK